MRFLWSIHTSCNKDPIKMEVEKWEWVSEKTQKHHVSVDTPLDSHVIYDWLWFINRHMSTLKQLYGYQLLINLLGGKEGEAILSSSYRDHLKDSRHNFDTHMIAFDYHRHCGGGKSENIKLLLDKAKPSIENFQFFAMVDGEIVK